MSEKENIKIEVPFEVKFQSAKNDIFATINAAYSNGVPFYLIEVIVSDILHQVQLGSKIEVEQAAKNYASAIESAKSETVSDTSSEEESDGVKNE